MASPPSSVISLMRFDASSSRRSAITTLAPSKAKSFAVAAPIPNAPPVTSATLFSNRRIISPYLNLDI